MRNCYPLPLLAFLLLVFGYSGRTQTLQPNYGAPATSISVCNGNVVFKVKIIGSSSPCTQGVINITLPSGYVYAGSSASVTGGQGTVAETTVNTNTATLTVMNIPASPDSTVISYQAFANCSAIGTATSSNSQVYYTLNSPCLGSYMVTSNTFNTQSAALSIPTITNSSYNGAVGDVYTRAITITNNGLGAISQFTIKDTSGNGFYISSVTQTAGWTLIKTKAVAGTDTIATYLLTGPQLTQGQSVVISENIKLVNKCYLQTRYSAYFGCSGTACTNNNVNANASAGATVNSSLAPNLKVIPVPAALVCRGQQYAQTIKLANIGTAALYNLSFNLFSSTWSAVASTQYFSATRNALSGGQSAYANFTYKLGANGTYAALPLDSTKTFSSPGSSIAGMPASVYAVIPTIKAGDTLFITYNELNSPLPGLNSGNTMEASGGELRYTYMDGCGIATAPVATFVRNYVQTRINTLSAVPTNMQQAQTYQALYNFSESNSGAYIYTGITGSTLRFSATLPANISFSGLASDISLTSGSTGLPIATASSFSYNAATNIINVIYPISIGFSINAMLNGNFKIGGLTLNCAAASTGNNVVLNCYLKANSTCSNEEWMFSQSDKVNFVCPAACATAGGMYFTGFSSTRTNYGLPDNDNNGVADAAGSIDFTKVKKTYAMLGDTVQAMFTGKINAGVPVTGFKYGYAVDTLSAYNTSITSLYAGIQLFASGSTTAFYTCNNLPVSGGTTATRKVDFSIAALNAACPLPGGYTQYNDGDSVVVKIYYRISANIGGSLGVVNIANKFLISTVANPATAQQYTCGGNYTGNFTIVGNGAGSGTGNLTYSIVGNAIAATQGSNVGYMGPCCTTAGSKPFAYEYRRVTIYDSMSYTVPPGYDFVSATMAYSYTTGTGVSGTKTIVITPVNAAASPLVFNLGALFTAGTLPYGDQGSSMTVTVNIRPNCAAQPKSTAYIYIRQSAAPGTSSGLAPYPVNFADTIYLTPASLGATAANTTVTTNTGTASWEVQLSNSSVATASSVWMAKDTGAGAVTITSVQKLSGPGGSVVSTVTPVAGIYQLGSFGQISNYYRINATYTSCVKDSINLAYWYDCNGSGYPGSVTASPYRQDLKLSVIPQQASLQISILSEPAASTSHNFCDTLMYTLETLNAGPGSVTNMKVQVGIPAPGAITYTPGSFQLQFPAGTGTYVTIPDANVSVSGTTVTYSIPSAVLTQLNANQGYRIKFGMQTSCGFASGQSIWVTPYGTIACGQSTSGITQQSQKIQLAGAPATTNLYGIVSGVDTAAQACVSGDHITAGYRFKIINQGPLVTSSSDWFTIQLPASWQLDTTSINYLHNPGAGAYNSVNSGLYNFTTGIGLAAGDSVVLTATLFVPAPVAATVPTGLSTPIIENAIVRFVGYCSATNTACPGGQVIVSTNQTTIIPVAHPLYTIGGFSIQQNTSRDTSIAGTITIRHTDTLYAAQNVTVKLYKDLNANSSIDAGDSLLGQASFPLAGSSTQTFKYNINSAYAANLCPAVIALADFGCYTVPFAYNCTTATNYYSNAGATKKLQQCDTAVFSINAADASGKWVLDSGTAVIANRYLPATSVTVAAGDAVRLLWYAYAPGNSGAVKVYPDTIRLINNSRPVINGLTNQTVCAGDPVAFNATATVVNAIPVYQWTKNSVTIPGATAALLNVSSAAQTTDAGLYTITATGNNGCASADSAVLLVHAAPVAGTLLVTNPSICDGSSTVLSISNPLPATSYHVYTDSLLTVNAGVLTVSSNSLTITPLLTTSYYTQAVTDSSGCKQQTPVVKLTVTVNPNPVLVITDPVAVCSPATVDITAAAVTAGSTAGLTFTYFTDALAIATLPKPNAVTGSATYYIKGTTAAGCIDIKPVTITINPKPTVVIANPTAVCSPAAMDITISAITAGSTAGLSYTYFTDTLATTALANPNAIAISGTYYIKGSTLAGCSDIKPVTVTINPTPVLVITDPAAVCSPATIDITTAAVTTGSTAGLTFTYFTDAAATTALATSAAIAISGTYFIKGSTAAGCDDIKSVTITINPKPSVVIADPLPVCPPATIDITTVAVTAGSTAGLTFTYFTDALATAVLSNANAITSSGTYYIKGSTVLGCEDIQPVTVTINATPTVVITNPAPVCSPAVVDITAAAVTNGSTAGLLFTYFTDALATTALINPSAIAASGTYYINGKTAAGCSDIKPVTVTINPKPTVAVTSPAAVCAPSTIDITAAAVTTGSTAGLTFGYFTDALATGTLANPNAIAASATYYIKGNTAAGCYDIEPVTVVVNPQPVLLITNPPTLACSPVPVTADLTAAAVTAGSTPGLSYSYYTDAAATASLANPNAVSQSGVYYIKGTNTVTGCSSGIKAVTVTIDTRPAVTASASAAAICKGDTVTLSAASPGNSIAWLESGPGSNITVKPAETTVYTVVATAAGGCTDTATVKVDVMKLSLVLTANPNPVLAGTSTTITTSGNYSYSILSWSPAVFFSNQSATSQTITVKDSSKTFTVTGKSADGCLDTVSLKIMIDPNLKDFFIPNAFTPNNDGKNDVFKIYGSSVKELHLMIFNQWGQQVFETRDPAKGWDGTFRGNLQTAGAYIYVVKAIFYNGVEYSKKGTLNLIR